MLLIIIRLQVCLFLVSLFLKGKTNPLRTRDCQILRTSDWMLKKYFPAAEAVADDGGLSVVRQLQSTCFLEFSLSSVEIRWFQTMFVVVSYRDVSVPTQFSRPTEHNEYGSRLKKNCCRREKIWKRACSVQNSATVRWQHVGCVAGGHRVSSRLLHTMDTTTTPATSHHVTCGLC